MGSTKPEHIQLKDDIAGTLGDNRAISNSPGRTEERDEAAEWLIENVLNEGLWPLSYGKLADMSDWSAGHIRNTYERYFEPATDSPDSEPPATPIDTLNTGNMSIDVPDTVTDMPSFIAGISVGYKLANEEEQ